MSPHASLVKHGDYVFARFRARVEGLGDEEYLWEPVPGSWSLRERDGTWDIDGHHTLPGDATPVPTIAWRMVHLGGSNLLGFAARHFEGVPKPEDLPVPGTAAGAADLCELGHRSWQDGFTALGEEGMLAKLGPLAGAWADSNFADLHLHVYDEVIHHAAEIGLLRDLYRERYTR